ncbi:MAG: hypothetical protein H0W72_14075, partial [Planctomycetes bacterium]|nr:hypothetical protein [Planctomycetota bacterium]
MSDGGFSFGLVGLSPLVVLPVMALAVWGIARLARPELESQPPQVQRGLAWLRRGAVALILLMLLEPTLTRLARERELPTVAVLVDRSGSMALTDRQMAATDRLDEAVGLG